MICQIIFLNRCITWHGWYSRLLLVFLFFFINRSIIKSLKLWLEWKINLLILFLPLRLFSLYNPFLSFDSSIIKQAFENVFLLTFIVVDLLCYGLWLFIDAWGESERTKTALWVLPQKIFFLFVHDVFIVTLDEAI